MGEERTGHDQELQKTLTCAKSAIFAFSQCWCLCLQNGLLKTATIKKKKKKNKLKKKKGKKKLKKKKKTLKT